MGLNSILELGRGGRYVEGPGEWQFSIQVTESVYDHRRREEPSELTVTISTATSRMKNSKRLHDWRQLIDVYSVLHRKMMNWRRNAVAALLVYSFGKARFNYQFSFVGVNVVPATTLEAWILYLRHLCRINCSSATAHP